MLHLKVFLEYLIILYIFRISLCVTSPSGQDKGPNFRVRTEDGLVFLQNMKV